jgi:AraC-like DNA-binding protein
VTFQAAIPIIRFARVAVVKPFVTYLESVSVPTAKYLLQVGLNPAMLEDPATPIPTSLVFEFFNTACKAEDIDDIGLLVGRATSLQMMDEFGKRLLASRNIGKYLKLGCRLISSTSSGDHYWLAEEDNEIRFCQSISGLSEPDRIQSHLYISLVTINTIRQASKDTWCPTEITIPGMGPGTTAKLAAVLPRTKIIRKGSYASFLIPHYLLAHPILAKGDWEPDAELHSATLALPSDFVPSIAQLIEALIIAGNPDIHTAASATGLSCRMFQRRLADSGTNYSALLAKTRTGMAMRWIRHGNRSLADIASTLGYTDQANFSRAFRRVTGLSPRAYRDSIR